MCFSRTNNLIRRARILDFLSLITQAAARRRRAATAAIYAAAGSRAVVADATAPGGFVYVDVPGSANDEDDATAAHAHCDSDPLRIGDGVTGDVVRGGRTAVRASVIHHHHSVLSHVDAAAHAAGYTPAVHVPDMPPRVVWAPRTRALRRESALSCRRFCGRRLPVGLSLLIGLSLCGTRAFIISP